MRAAAWLLVALSSCRCAERPSPPPVDAGVAAVAPVPTIDAGTDTHARVDWDGPLLVHGRTDIPCEEAGDGGTASSAALDRATSGLAGRMDLVRVADPPQAATLGTPTCEDATCGACASFDPHAGCTKFRCERVRRYLAFADTGLVVARATLGAGVPEATEDVDGDCWPEKTKELADCRVRNEPLETACRAAAVHAFEARCAECVRRNGCDGGACGACSDLCETDNDVGADCGERFDCGTTTCHRTRAGGFTIDEIALTQAQSVPERTTWWLLKREGRPDVRIQEDAQVPGRLLAVIDDGGGAVRLAVEKMPTDSLAPRELAWTSQMLRIDAAGRIEHGRTWTYPTGCQGLLDDAACCSR